MRSIKFRNSELIPVMRFELSGEVDRYGDPVGVWANLDAPLRAAVANKSTEIQFSPGRAELDFDFTLYLEAGQTVLPADKVLVRGQWCKVVVPQFEWQSPFIQWSAGSVVYVKDEAS